MVEADKNRQQTINGLERNKGFKESSLRLRDSNLIGEDEFVTSWGYISDEGVSNFPGGRDGFGETVYVSGLEAIQFLVGQSDLPEGTQSIGEVSKLVQEVFQSEKQFSGVRRGTNFYFVVKLRPGCETQMLIESIQKKTNWNRL